MSLEADPTATPEAGTDPDKGPRTAANDWRELLNLTADMGTDLGHLLLLELRLALSSAGRIVILALVCLPLLFLAWLGLSTLPAVLLYQWSGSAALAVFLFLMIQVLALGLAGAALARYSRALSLPNTRRQLRNLVNGP